MEVKKQISVCLLHENVQFLNQCAELLNKQWPRSQSARIQSLEKSFPDLPDSVLLIEQINEEKYVIGHSRLTRVLEDSSGCWIQSVVVSEEKRNKGYGRYIMNKTEEYAKKLNFSTAYLSTHDKMDFYEYLGYKFCQPVSPISFRQQGFIDRGILVKTKNDNYLASNNNQRDESKYAPNKSVLESAVNIPPPPPLPQTKLLHTPKFSNLGQYWMKKIL